MSKNRNLKENISLNFVLRGLNSIQIGLYVLLGAYLLKFLLVGFVSGELPIGMLSIEIIEVLGISSTLLVFIFSSLAVFYSSRRNTRKSGFKVWNKKSKRHFWIFFLLVIGCFTVMKIVHSFGYISFLTPIFLAYLSLFLFFLNTKKKRRYYMLSLVSLLLSGVVFTIPTYWYSAILIMGISFIVYGIMVRK